MSAYPFDAAAEDPYGRRGSKEALDALGRKTYESAKEYGEDYDPLTQNAALIESPEFIDEINHSIKDYLQLPELAGDFGKDRGDFEIKDGTENADVARAIGYYLQRRLAGGRP